jgi:hypothetical protein
MIGTRCLQIAMALSLVGAACQPNVASSGSFYCTVGADCAPLVTFTPRLVKRPAPPFAAGVRFQGTESVGDSLALPRGAAVDGAYYAQADGGQGTVVLWVTLDWEVKSLVAGYRGLFNIAGMTLSVDGAIQGFVVDSPAFGRASFPALAAAFKVGEQHFVALRWDALRPLADGQHVALTVDAVTQLGIGSPFAPPTPEEMGSVGAADAQGTRPLSGSIAGLTVFRRPLFDGTSGIDLGHGDELGAVYNAGVGVDPVGVAGLWDVLVAVPTDGIPGIVDPMKRHAWTLDRAANALGVVGAAPSPSGWVATGATLAIAPDLEAVYGRALQVTTAGGTINAAAVLPGGGSYVVRALVHGDPSSQPVLIVRSNGSELGRVLSRRTSSRQHPEELVATGALAPGETDFEVTFTNAGTGSFVVHEVLVYDNLLANPSFEAWEDTGRLAPVGWQVDNLWDFETTQESTLVHSGAVSLRIMSSDPDSALDSVVQEDLSSKDGEFVAAGGFFYWLSSQAPGIRITNGQLMQALSPQTPLEVTGVAADVGWQHLVAAGRINESAYNAYYRHVLWGGPGYYRDTDLIVDDAYLVPLTRYVVEPRAATFDQSLAGGFVRIDGGDVVQQLATGLTADRGKLRLRMVLPRACDGMAWVVGVWGDLENELHVVREAGAWILSGVLDGEAVGLTLMSPALSPGVESEITLSYDMATGVSLEVDGQHQVDVSTQGHKLAFAPILLAFGRSSDGRGDCDILLRLPGAEILEP